jgi:hypothetical protein
VKQKQRFYFTVSSVILVYFLSIFAAIPGFSAPPPFPPPPPGMRRPVPPPPRPRVPPPPGPRIYPPPPRGVFVPPPGRRFPFPPPPPRVVIRHLPADVLTLSIAGALFFYHLGEYYQRTNDGYVVVDAPIGARISVLPGGCSSMRVGRNLYFNCEGVYYEPVAGGFVVVEAPQTIREVAPDAQEGDWVSIQTDVLNVRTGPGKRFEVVNQLYRGQTVKVFGVDRSWYYVELPDESYGWIMSQYTELRGRRHHQNDGSKG